MALPTKLSCLYTIRNNIQAMADVARPDPVHPRHCIEEYVGPTATGGEDAVGFGFAEVSDPLRGHLDHGRPHANPELTGRGSHQYQCGFKRSWHGVIRLSLVAVSIGSGLLGGFLCRSVNTGLGIGAGVLAVLMALSKLLNMNRK